MPTRPSGRARVGGKSLIWQGLHRFNLSLGRLAGDCGERRERCIGLDSVSSGVPLFLYQAHAQHCERAARIRPGHTHQA